MFKLLFEIRQMMCKRMFLFCMLALFFAMPANGEVIFYEDFSGSAVLALNGLSPDIDAIGGSDWIANSIWTADGGLSPNISSATIPFSPESGKIYMVTARLRDVAIGDWMGVGYTYGSHTGSGTNVHRFIEGSTAGQPWQTHRSEAAPPSYEDQCFTVGTSGGANIGHWTDDVDSRIILDTSTSPWSVEWQQRYADGVSAFSSLRTYQYGTNPSIGAVGVCNSNTDGRLEFFMLEEVEDGRADTPAPYYGQTEVSVLMTTLSWDIGTAPNITGHYLYMAKGSPNFEGVSPVFVADLTDPIEASIPLTLEKEARYFWRVDESVNNSSATDSGTVTGAVWFFDTGNTVRTHTPDPSNSVPEIGNIEVDLSDRSVSGAVSWSAPVDSDIVSIFGYNVYMDTDESKVANATPASNDLLYKSLQSGGQIGTSFDPGSNLDYNTTYYWRVDAVVDLASVPGTGQDALSGVVWAFITERRVDYATWLMIWKDGDNADWRGVTTPRGGEWKAPDWSNYDWRHDVYADLVDAGVNVLIADTTNGYFLRANQVHSEVHDLGFKFCLSLGTSHLNVEGDPSYIDDVWDDHANHSVLKDSYLNVDGKPALICYVLRATFEDLEDSTNPKLTRFKLIWSSGEDAEANKAGWQNEPQNNSIPSSGIMYVTSSIKHNTTRVTGWHKSQAAIDYGFELVEICDPDLPVVGSYDDVAELNGWLTMDMTNADDQSYHFYDTKSGLLADPYYLRSRVEQWIKLGQPDEVAGGLVGDGIYRLKNVCTGTYMKVPTNNMPNTSVVAGSLSPYTYEEFGFYHNGNDQYRIENVYSGWTIRQESTLDSGALKQGYHAPDDDSLFKLISTGTANTYYIQSQKSGKCLEIAGCNTSEGASITQASQANLDRQKWVLEIGYDAPAPSCNLEFDFSGPNGVPDCVVNIYDLVVFMENWLSCGKYPDCF